MKKFKKLTLAFIVVLFSGLISPIYPCETGGNGAGSCEYDIVTSYWHVFYNVTTVSTSCGDGYYACCDHTGAECIEDGEAEPNRVRVLQA